MASDKKVQFSVYLRGGSFYARFTDEEGRQSSRSVDKLARQIGWEKVPVKKLKDAQQVCSMALGEGLSTKPKSRLTAESWMIDWWDFKGERITRKNKLNPNSISEHYANIMALNIRLHVVPRLPKGLALSEVKPNHIKAVSDSLADDPTKKRGTVAKIMQAVSAPMKAAYKQGLVSDDPTRLLEPIDASGEKRGIVTDKEFSLLMHNLRKERHALLATKVAASTGMRFGEIVAMKKDSLQIKGDLAKINIDKAWSVVGGIKSPKGKRNRETYIPKSLAEDLLTLHSDNPYKGDYIFWSVKKANTPVSEKYIRERFYQALDISLCEAAGLKYSRIADKVKKGKSIRESRNICFHSLRHFYVTTAGSMTDETLLRLAVGHTNEAMTDRYTHIDERRAKSLTAISEQILGQ